MSAQRPPALFVESEKETRDQLRVDQMDVKVFISGNVAETSVTMRFRNDTKRILEGEFVCPLNENQTVSGYSLEIEDEMRAGVAVEKQQARQVFEDIVRQNIDPGLAEWTKGNNFRTRVYPIPGNGTKRVGVTYRETLEMEGDELRYRFPLEFKKPLSRFSISITAPHAKGELKELEDPSSGLTFQQTGNRGWRLGSIRKNFTPKGALEVGIPIERKAMVSVGAGPDGKMYFHLVDRVDRPGGDLPERDVVKSIRLIWDASGSGGLRDHEKEFGVLRGMLSHHEGATVELTLLRHQLEDAGSFDDADALIGQLRKTIYDGGTDPGLLDLSKVKEELVILVSDGIGTLGRNRLLPGGNTVHVFHAAGSAEHERLAHLARASGGRYLNLVNLSVEEGLERMTKPVFQLISVEGVVGALPSGPVPVTANGRVDFTGRLEGDEPITLTLNFGYGARIITSREIVINPENDLTKGGRIGKIWAEKQLTALLGEREKNREEITKLGRKFGMMTPYTSLLVLDRIEDYVEHRIVPPTAKLRKEYDRLVKLDDPKGGAGKDHLDDLLIQWREMVAWHGKKFDPIDVLLFQRLQKDRKEVGSLLKRRFFSRAPKLTKEERSKLTEVQGKLEVLQKALADFEKVPLNQRRKVISDYADRYAALRKNLYGGRHAAGGVSNIVTAGNRSGANAVSRNSIDGILNRVKRRAERESDAFGGSPAPAPAMAMGPGGDEEEGTAKIRLAKWDPKTPYLTALKKASKSNQEKVYLEWRKKNLKSSSFYLDVSNFFLDQGKKELALRVLTNVAELDLESVPLMRVLAHRLNQLGEHQRALAVFEEVKKLRPDEPQSRRDVALTMAQLKRYQEAGDTLWEIIKEPNDDRFEGIHLIALVELNALVSRHGIRTSSYDRRFINKMDCDARIILTWDSNDSDMDLWVTDPLGELCNYAKNRTEAGGRMSNDFTDGYGPEEFLVKRALHGKYRVEVNFFGTRQQIIAGATTIQVEIFTNWGRRNQKSKKVTLRLKDKSELVYVGEFELR